MEEVKTMSERYDGINKSGKLFTGKNFHLIGEADPYDSLELTDDPTTSVIYVLVNTDFSDEYEVATIKFYGPTIDDVDVEWDYDTWSDPGEYPSGAGGYSLSDVETMYVKSATTDITKGNLKHEFNRYVEADGVFYPITKEEFMKMLDITEPEFNEVLDVASEEAFMRYKNFMMDVDRLNDIL